MATRNTIGRRLMSKAELESFNPFDEGGFDFIPEPVLQPAVAVPQPTPVATSAPSSNAVPSLEEILAVGPGNYLNVGGKIYQPVFQESGSGENQVFGGPIAIMTYDLNKTGPGEVYNWTDLNTGITQRNEFTKSRGFFGDLLRDVGDVAKTVAPIAAAALTMGGAGGLIGGTLSGGALSGPAASALGNALISGGAGALTGQDPLQAALLAAGGTYAGSLFGGGAPQSTVSDAQFIAADAAQLAAQGISAPQIEQVLQASGVSSAAAIGAADAAVSGLSIPEIAQEITLGNRGLFTEAVSQAPVAPTEVITSPEGLQTVTVPAAAPVASISDIVAAIPSAVLPQAATPTVDLPPLEPVGLMAPEAPVTPVPEQVTVTAPKVPEAPEVTLSDALAALSGIVPVTFAEVPQTVEVTGAKQQTQPDNTLAAVAPLATIVPPEVTPPNEVIEVTGNKGVTSEDTGSTIGAISGVLEPGVGPQSGGGLETADQAARTEKQDTGLTLKDLYTALQALGALSSTGLFGGGGGGTQRSFVAPTATVPMGNADYYNAVQQYYNTYMPQTPRDVATPLQQWYEGKFGG